MGNGRTESQYFLVPALALIAAATILGVIAAGNNVLEIDWRLSRFFQRWQGDLPARLHHIGDMLGDTAAAVSGLILLTGLAALLRNWRLTAFITVVAGLRLAATALKPIFDSPRPTETDARVRIYEQFEGIGYPSGHSMTAAMFAFIAILLVWHIQTNRQTQRAVTVVAAVFMVFVGWTRIWSGAHWPTDVLGGWCYGVALVLIAWFLTERIGSGTERPTPESQPGQQAGR